MNLFPTITLKQLGLMTGTALLASVVLAESYLAVSNFGFQPWVSAALINSLVGAAVLILYRSGYLSAGLPAADASSRRWLWAYAPAAIVLVGSALLALTTRWLIDGSDEAIKPPQVMAVAGWVLWVPVVEELVFRVGFGGLMRRWGGLLWGTYLSVILFSFMHTLPTIERLLSGEVGFTLGTLLLGAACELVWIFTKSFGAICSLHAVCNFTVVVFSLIDSRWLTWLGPIYL